MPYDEGIAQRARETLDDQCDTKTHKIVEKKMFGGLAFMVNGNMCCGVVGSRLMVRVGPDQYESALKLPYARPMDFTGKALKGLLYVDEPGFEQDTDLGAWIGRALVFMRSLPSK